MISALEFWDSWTATYVGMTFAVTYKGVKYAGELTQDERGLSVKWENEPDEDIAEMCLSEVLEEIVKEEYLQGSYVTCDVEVEVDLNRVNALLVEQCGEEASQ